MVGGNYVYNKYKDLFEYYLTIIMYNDNELHTNTCILLPDQYFFICKISLMMLLSISNSFYHGYYDMSLLATIIQFTSILYWSKPEYNWKRNTDMIVANFTALYHCVRAYGSENSILFYIFTSLGIFCYFISWDYFYKKKYWYSVYSHSGVHICFNLAINSLYFGHIVSICNNEIIIYFINTLPILYNSNICSILVENTIPEQLFNRNDINMCMN